MEETRGRTGFGVAPTRHHVPPPQVGEPHPWFIPNLRLGFFPKNLAAVPTSGLHISLCRASFWVIFTPFESLLRVLQFRIKKLIKRFRFERDIQVWKFLVASFKHKVQQAITFRTHLQTTNRLRLWTPGTVRNPLVPVVLLESRQRAAGSENLKWPLWPTMVDFFFFSPLDPLRLKKTKKKAYDSDTNEG